MSARRQPFVVGNWKMNKLRGESVRLASAVAAVAREHRGTVDVGIAPPAIWLVPTVRAAKDTPLRVFGQNASDKVEGALTGEISPAMLSDASCTGVILGHSERRHVFGEDDELIGRKVALAREKGLHVILCVGETLDDRDAGRTWEIVRRQAEGGLSGLDSSDEITIAYEPVWAIGTGRTATPEQAEEVHAQLHEWLSERFGGDADLPRVQYGGSVKPSNAAELLAQPHIDGALVGGASLRAESFEAIVRAAAKSAS